jgi:hypothetical protein
VAAMSTSFWFRRGVLIQSRASRRAHPRWIRCRSTVAACVGLRDGSGSLGRRLCSRCLSRGACGGATIPRRFDFPALILII